MSLTFIYKHCELYDKKPTIGRWWVFQCSMKVTSVSLLIFASCTFTSLRIASKTSSLVTTQPQYIISIVGMHIPLREDAFLGRGQASSGRHDVGHKGVATGCGALSLYSFVTPAGSRLSRLSRWSRLPSFHVLFFHKNTLRC